jgi:hypothetical protein
MIARVRVEQRVSDCWAIAQRSGRIERDILRGVKATLPCSRQFAVNRVGFQCWQAALRCHHQRVRAVSTSRTSARCGTILRGETTGGEIADARWSKRGGVLVVFACGSRLSCLMAGMLMTMWPLVRCAGLSVCFANMFLSPAHGQGNTATGSDAQFWFTQDAPPNDTRIQMNCGDANLHAKYNFAAPPACAGSGLSPLYVVSSSPDGCAIRAELSPSGAAMQNLGRGWRHWVLGTFSLQGGRCRDVRTFVRAVGVGYQTEWHDLDVVRYDRVHVTFARNAKPPDDYLEALAAAQTNCLPPNRRPNLGSGELLALQIWACRAGSGGPLNGCRPGTPAGAFAPASPGMAPDVVELASFTPPTPLPNSLGAIDPKIGCAVAGSDTLARLMETEQKAESQGREANRGTGVGPSGSATLQALLDATLAQEAAAAEKARLASQQRKLQSDEQERQRRETEQRRQPAAPPPATARSNGDSCEAAKTKFQNGLTAASATSGGEPCATQRAAVNVWNVHRASVASACSGTSDFAAMMKQTDDYIDGAKRYLAQRCGGY